MGNKLYVGNLPYDADESMLRTFFGNGRNGRLVTRIRMVTDSETGQRRGFAFVELNGPEQTRNAIATLNGRLLNGRPVVIREAHESKSSRIRPQGHRAASEALRPAPSLGAQIHLHEAQPRRAG